MSREGNPKSGFYCVAGVPLDGDYRILLANRGAASNQGESETVEIQFERSRDHVENFDEM